MNNNALGDSIKQYSESLFGAMAAIHDNTVAVIHANRIFGALRREMWHQHRTNKRRQREIKS